MYIYYYYLYFSNKKFIKQPKELKNVQLTDYQVI